MPGSRNTSILKLRARTTGDSISFRRRIERDLLHADVHPSWLPEESILCIRHIRLVNCTSLSGTLKERLEALRGTEVRPIEEAVPQCVNAVLFRDEAERIACFTEDWLSGEAHARWWWRKSLSAQELVQGAPALWIANACYAPAAMLLLARKNLEKSFVLQLNAAQRGALLKAVQAAFQIDFALPGFGVSVDGGPQTSVSTRIAPAEIEDAVLPIASRAVREQRILLHVVLELARGAAHVRSRAFQERVERWWFQGFGVAALPVAEVISLDRVHRAEPAEAGAHRESQLPSEPPVMVAAKSVETDEQIVRTQLGGVFYLLNLAVFLNIYQDFTSPSEDANLPSVWKFVEWLATSLYPVQSDPPDAVWSLLRELTQEDDRPIPSNWDLAAIGLRLSEALNIPEAELGGFLLHREARIRITLTHISVFYQLPELQVAIRHSGLDRNPGWVPSAGRFIHFYYE